jgi:hypothetical protein
MRPTVQTPELTKHMFDELQRPVKKLTRWELDFIADVSLRFERLGTLTPAQFSKLEEIYTEKTA